jgi:hypothetical protein
MPIFSFSRMQHSMGKADQGFGFYESGAFGCGLGKAFIDLVEVLLKAVLNLVCKFAELNPHAYSRVAGPDNGFGTDFVGVQPKGDDDGRVHTQRRKCLHVAAAAADIGRAALNVWPMFVVKADGHWETDFVTRKAAFFGIAFGCCAAVLNRDFSPWRSLVRENLYSSRVFSRDLSRIRPNYFEAGLLLPVLDTDNVTNFQTVMEFGELRPVVA